MPSDADRVDDRAVDALQLLVVARLQSGQAGQVADLVGVGVVLDHLGGDLADRAEDRQRELAGRRERELGRGSPTPPLIRS